MDRKYYTCDSSQFCRGRIPTKVLESSDAVFRAMATQMADTIEENNRKGEKTVFIVPVGPVGQYPHFVDQVLSRRISLKDTWLINMDEYLDDDLNWIDDSSPLSFRGFMDRNVYSRIPDELNVPRQQRIFPDPARSSRLTELVEELGKIDICFGGIGINGHLAFNESEEVPAWDFATRTTRVITISRETRCANAIGDLGGAIDAMPKYAVTIGMSEILKAGRIRLGVFRTWHRAVVRQAIFDEPSGHFPVTLLQGHPDALIYVNDIAAEVAFEQ